MSLFVRAAANQPLSPGERAILKLIESTLISALLSGFVAIYPYLASASADATPAWQPALHTFAVTVALSILLSVVKWFKANNEPMLAGVVQMGADALSQKTGVSEPVTPAAPPALASVIGPAIAGPSTTTYTNDAAATVTLAPGL